MTIYRFKKELYTRGLASYDYLTDENFSIHFSTSDYLSRNRIYLQWYMEKSFYLKNDLSKEITAHTLNKYIRDKNAVSEGVETHLSLGASFFYNFNGEAFHFLFEQSDKMQTATALLETILKAKSKIVRLPIQSVANALAAIADKSISSTDFDNPLLKANFIRSLNRETFLAQSIFNDYHLNKKRAGKLPTWKRQPTSA
ncbi:hypothetical protein WJU16_03165 [Chitinophaga pollutisoli]|uniref:Uncharacterized protein n=1 Tax=Chitinophaga pollutisoli TaxID=3133966 RepID=A0ABZ2YQH3_9BACT